MPSTSPHGETAPNNCHDQEQSWSDQSMKRANDNLGLVKYALTLVLIAMVVMAAMKNVGATTNVLNTANSGVKP